MSLHTGGDDVLTYKRRRCLNIQEETMSLHTRRRCLYIQEETMSLHTGADDVFTYRRR